MGSAFGKRDVSEIRNIMATRDAIIQRSTLLEGLARSPQTDAPGAAARGNAFAAALSEATVAHPQTSSSEPSFSAAPSAGPAAGLASTLSTLLGRVNTTQQREDDLTDAYQRGEETDIAKVMLAEQTASVSFEATLQVRNKLLSAYQDIMRMQV